MFRWLVVIYCSCRITGSLMPTKHDWMSGHPVEPLLLEGKLFLPLRKTDQVPSAVSFRLLHFLKMGPTFSPIQRKNEQGFNNR